LKAEVGRRSSLARRLSRGTCKIEKQAKKERRSCFPMSDWKPCRLSLGEWRWGDIWEPSHHRPHTETAVRISMKELWYDCSQDGVNPKGPRWRFRRRGPRHSKFESARGCREDDALGPQGAGGGRAFRTSKMLEPHASESGWVLSEASASGGLESAELACATRRRRIVPKAAFVRLP
jgi:hypothetical protein